MGIINSSTSWFGSQDRTFEYVCQNCDAEFTSQKAKMTDVDCPECHATQAVNENESAIKWPKELRTPTYRFSQSSRRYLRE